MKVKKLKVKELKSLWILAALLAIFNPQSSISNLHAATMASQPWTTNRIAEAEARLGAQIGGKADKTNTYTRAEADAKIVELAPSPGDYATVSNRAMSALQNHQSLQPSTNYTDKVAEEFEYGTRSVSRASSANDADYARYLYDYSSMSGFEVGDLVRESTNAANAVVQAASNNLTRTLMSRSHEDGDERVSIGFDYGPSGLAFVPSALYAQTAYFDHVIIANENDTNGPLSGIGQYSQSPKTARQEMVEYVESAIRKKSLGGIWDQQLEVWWTPVMVNGALTYQATTNVNLNAEGN